MKAIAIPGQNILEGKTIFPNFFVDWANHNFALFHGDA